MKIGILTTSYPAYNGHLQSPFIHNLAKTLASKGYDVKVVCPYYGKFSKKNEIMDNVEIKRFQYFPLRLQKVTAGGGIPSSMKASYMAKLNIPFFIVSFIYKGLKELKDCDIIHSQWVLSGIPGIFLKKFFGKKMIITTRGAEINIAIDNLVLRKILQIIFKNTDFITPNNESHVEIIKQLGISETKIKAIPNGIDLESFKPRNKREIRGKLNLPQDKKIVLFVGWLIERKGVGYLLEAASRIKNRDVLFLIIGNGILEDSLRMQAKSLGLENIKFLGAKDSKDIPYWMSAADIFVLPSLSEGRPNVVAEAASSGLPVIATNVNGTPELIDERMGFLIPPKDSNAIYEKLKILLEDEKLRKRLEKNSRKLIISKIYSWEKCAENYLEIYKKCVG